MSGATLQLEPLIHGAGHEQGRRAGTESALLAAGLGAACTLAGDLSPMARVRTLRDKLWHGLKERFRDGIVLNGHPEHRLPNTLNVSFAGQIGAELLARLDGVAASTGSACHAGRIELSPVLRAMGVAARGRRWRDPLQPRPRHHGGRDRPGAGPRFAPALNGRREVAAESS